MAKEETLKKPVRKVPFGKNHWIVSLVIDSALFALNTGAAVYTCVAYKQGKIKDEGLFPCGLAAGLNAGCAAFGATEVVKDIKHICRINKAVKEECCNPNTVSVYDSVTIEYDKPTDSVTTETESKIGFKADC